MPDQIIKFLTNHGGEAPDCKGRYYCAPLAHNEHQDKFDLLEVGENTNSEGATYTTFKRTCLASLQHDMEKQNDPADGNVLKIACIPLIIDGDWYSIDLKRNHYHGLLDTFGLRDLVRDLAHTSGMTYDIIPRFSNNKLVGIQYSVFVSNYIGLYFTCEFNGTAHGIVWGHINPGDSRRSTTLGILKAALIEFDYLAEDPFYLLFAFIVSLMSSLDRRFTRVRREVAAVESHTGYHDWGDLHLSEGLPDSSIEHHLARYSAELSGMATTLASDRRFIRMGLNLISTITQPVWCDHTMQSTIDESLQLRTKENLMLLDRRFRTHLDQADLLEARVRNQLAAVQNLISRNEMNLSIRLANDSKTLANAMKILAIITVVFLPATFVASLFSTSLFDWHLKESDYVSPYLWVFWVIAIPLTMGTVVCFVLLNRRWNGNGGGNGNGSGDAGRRLADEEASEGGQGRSLAARMDVVIA